MTAPQLRILLILSGLVGAVAAATFAVFLIGDRSGAVAPVAAVPSASTSSVRHGTAAATTTTRPAGASASATGNKATCHSLAL